MPKFRVTLYKTEIYATEIEITAATQSLAEDMALADARHEDLEWSWQDTDLSAYVYETEELQSETA